MTSAILPAGLTAAGTAALRGMKMAERRVADAASGVALSGTGLPAPAPALVAATAAAADLPGAVGRLLQARNAYQASAAVLRTTDQVQDALLRRTA